MDNFFKSQLYKWTYEKIKSNPQKFGGDEGNPYIMHEYVMEHYGDNMVTSLQMQNFKIISSISRIRNILLEKNPQFDFRVKYKPKNTKNKVKEE
ncbi:hypothetical protein CPG38_06875 [Malaciobacter marinus]|uniref:hypothetical protein n=1 Tax=Malaciobacter marinus TaxID=505249 RepID=UPI000C06B4C5|nr:hypothetical protein [Malaciobacter marinus]PHO12565.1 hypothetical protein CPG38_06875 [Malaciobacter marinus]